MLSSFVVRHLGYEPGTVAAAAAVIVPPFIILIGASADLPAQQDTGATIGAAAKKLSPITPLAPYVDGLTHNRRSPRLKWPLLRNSISAIPARPFQKDGLNPPGTRADRREARGTKRCCVRSP